MPDNLPLVEKVIEDYWATPLPKMVDRGKKPSAISDHLVDIVGPRRSGKTYLMFLTIKKLMTEQNVPKEAILYINLENRRLSPVSNEHLDAIMEFIVSRQLFNRYGKVHLFLDEIQRVQGWERHLRSIYDENKGRLQIYISGSSSKLLAGETATLLTGRHLTFPVFPLDFREFLRFRGIEVQEKSADDLSEKKAARIKGNVKEYLIHGGFPEVVLREQKDELLSQLFTDIIQRDVVARAHIRHTAVLDEFSQFIASLSSGLLSFNKMSKYFESRNIKVSVPTLTRFFALMKDAFLFFDSPLFSFNLRAQAQNPRKVYCIDNGFARLMHKGPGEDWGNLLENLVAIQFHRRGIPTFYWRSQDQKEVDIIVRHGKRTVPIQVCYDLSRADTQAREVGALLAAMKELKVGKGWLINIGMEGVQHHGGNRINLVSLWKFLLFGLDKGWP